MRSLSIATVFAAASGFIVIWLASHTVDAAHYAEFQAYWGLFFALTGAIDGLMQETTRAVADAGSPPRPAPAAGASDRSRVAPAGATRIFGAPWRLAGWVAAIAAAVAAALSMVLMPQLVSGPTVTAGALLAVGLASYAFQAALSGILSGLKAWRRYAFLIACDSGVRLAACVAAWWFRLGIISLLVITVLGAASWLLVLAADPEVKQRISCRVGVSVARLARGAAAAMLATGASAALITGFPVFVKAAFGTGSGAGSSITIGGIILAVTLTRAPILVPLQRFQSALIVRFVDNRAHIYRAITAPVGLTLAAGCLGAGLAWLFGPAIMRVFFPADLFVPGPVLAALTFASAFTGSLMITGAAALAAEKHRLYVAGWVAASAVAFGVLFLPVNLAAGVCAALIAGPAAGIAIHLAALRGHSREPRRASTGDPARSGERFLRDPPS